jgi:quinol monooxygenase YgiN
MAKTLTIVAHARAKAGMEQRMIEAQIQLVEATRGTAGCLRYELHLSNHNPADVTFVEEWVSYDAWHAHMSSERIRNFQRTAGSTIASFQLHEMQQIS